MRIVRALEGVCGVLAGVLGLAGLGVAFWAPGNVSCISTTASDGAASQTCHNVSYIAANGLSGVLPVIVGVTIVFVALALGAVLHAWRGVREGRGILWVATVLLIFGNVLTLLSIGVFLFPSTALALAASVLAAIGRRETAPAPAA